MAAGQAKRRMSRTRDGQIEIGQAVVSVSPTRKRSRPLTDADVEGGSDNEEPIQRRKRLKVQSREAQPLEVQRAVPPPRENPKQFNTQGWPLNSETALRGKRLRSSVLEIDLHRGSKRQCRQSASGLSIEKADSIERWLDESDETHEPSVVGKILEAANDMPRKPSTVLPSPEDSFDRTTTSSRKSDRTSASVHDSDYRKSLRHRNIYINEEDPPPELIRRAKKIISRPRLSPEMDEDEIRQLVRTSRRVENESEEVIVQQLAPSIIPAMWVVPDQRLAGNADQPWNNSVPVPLDASILSSQLPLPKPKPDLTFGYSEAAFTRNQLGTIELLVDDKFGRSFVVPDQKVRFPFLCIEFKAQAKGGTHYIATNQAAGAGAISLGGVMDLMDRSSGMKNFDYEEPHFFSVTMDHELARINIHWIKVPATGDAHSFHVEGLSQHLLKDSDGIRAIVRAIKNILDEGTDKRLRTLCEALDAYREIIVRNKEAADPRKIRYEEAVKVLSQHGDRDRQPAQEINTKHIRHSPLPRKASADELAANQRNVKQVPNETRSTRHAKLKRPAAALTLSSRHSPDYAGKREYQTAPRLDTTSRHTITGAGESKRKIKPSQKLLESERFMSNSQGVKPKGRHDA